MIFNRYKNKDWRKARDYARTRLIVFLEGSLNRLAADEARLFLKCHYQGPWRMIFALFVAEAASAWLHYGWPKWEKFRTLVLRQPRNEAIADSERVEEEGEEVERIVEQL